MFTGQFPFTQASECPVYSHIYTLLGIRLFPHGEIHAQPRKTQQLMAGHKNIYGFLHISEKRKQHFLATPPSPPPALFGAKEVRTGIISLLPSWTSQYKQVVRKGHSEDGMRTSGEQLDGGPTLLLTERKEMCTHRRPLQFYL